MPRRVRVLLVPLALLLLRSVPLDALLLIVLVRISELRRVLRAERRMTAGRRTRSSCCEVERAMKAVSAGGVAVVRRTSLRAVHASRRSSCRGERASGRCAQLSRPRPRRLLGCFRFSLPSRGLTPLNQHVQGAPELPPPLPASFANLAPQRSSDSISLTPRPPSARPAAKSGSTCAHDLPHVSAHQD